jgi:DNA-binding CsgD family transcriptional regulator
MPKSRFAFTIVGMTLFWPLFRRNILLLLLPDPAFEIAQIKILYCIFLICSTVLVLLCIRFNQIVRAWIIKHPLLLLWVFLFQLLLKLVSLVFFLPVFFAQFAMVVNAALSAFVYVLLGVAWTSFISHQSSRENGLIAASSFLLSFCIQLLCSTNEVAAVLFADFSPLISLLCLHYSHNNASQESASHGTGSYRPSMLIVLLIIFLLFGSIIRGVFSDPFILFPSSGGITRDLLSIAFSFIILLICYFVPKKIRLYRLLWTILTMFFFAGLLLMVLFGTESGLDGHEYVVIGRTCICLLLVMVLSNFVNERNVRPFVVFGGYFILIDIVSSFVGYIVVPFSTASSEIVLESWAPYLVLGSTFALLIMTLVFIGSYAFADRNADHSPEAALPQMVTSESSQFEKLCHKSGLTAKEVEVARLLSQGHSQRKISQMTFVAIGTTQTHIKSIYRKLGIHSRQELIDLTTALITKHSSGC